MNRRTTGQRCAPLRAIVLGGILSLSAGCADFGLEPFRAELVQLRDQLAEDQAAWQRQVDGLSTSDPARPMLEARLAAATAQRAAADAAITQTDHMASEVENPTDPIGSFVGAIAPWLPEPVRTPLVLGSALVLTTARARQLKKGAASIAASLRRAMADDPQLADKIRQHAGTLRAIQTPTAARIVDEADPQRQLIRLPI